ncbi:MAG: hypothetical protein OXC26_20105 [Albidovulum sp.]|nr:hypothetical protein [Albidovulum sp.]
MSENGANHADSRRNPDKRKKFTAMGDFYSKDSRPLTNSLSGGNTFLSVGPDGNLQ